MTLPLLSIDLPDSFRFAILLGCGLLAPGWLLGRALRVRGGLAGALLGSAAILSNLLMVLDLCGVRLDAPRFAIALAGVCAVLALIAKARTSSAGPVESATIQPTPSWWRNSSGLLIPTSIGLLTIVLLGAFAPLAGWDCGFRWGYLASEIFRTGTMSFYPPITAEDFLHYSWCDGISPLVSSLYLWSFFSLGRIEAWATAPVVILQGVLIFQLVGRLATARGGAIAGAVAGAALASSAVLLWSVAMGQETGLTALTLIAMFWFIERGGSSPQAGWMIWAGIAAGVSGLAREYGLCFFLFGWLALVWGRRTRRQQFIFLATTVVVAAPWYLRVWVKTGHPLYCFDLGPLFPVNPVHVEHLHLVAHDFNVLTHPAMFAPLPGYLAMLAGVPLVLGIVGGIRRWRETGPWIVAMIALFFLWFWMAGLTGGGVLYSMRVLSPVVAMGAVLAGIWLNRVISGRWRWIVAAGLAGLALQAGETALRLPVTPYPAWWRESPLAWHEGGRLAQQWSRLPRWQAIADAAEGRKILAPDPTIYLLLKDHGARTVPMFSPEVLFLFEPKVNMPAAINRLREAGFRFIILSTFETGIMERVLANHPFFPALSTTLTPVPITRLYVLYDLYPPEQQRPAPPARPAGM